MRLLRLACFAAIVATSSIAGSAAAAMQAELARAKSCTPSEVKATVRNFIAAFNAGDAARLQRVFARKPDFKWFSTGAPGERLLPVAADRVSLLPYFAERHALGERLTLRSLRVNGNSTGAGIKPKPYGNFELRLVREASDLPPTPYAGKGALHCYRSHPDQLIVWSMAPDT